jgi:CRISPR/Cas system-associated endoribonuclease Cas2
LALKAYKRDKEKLREQYYAQLAEQNRLRMLEREQREAADLVRRNAQTQKDQLQQLAEYKSRHLAQQAAEQAEGEAIRQRVLDLQREEAEKEEARKRMAQQRNRENKEANVELAKLKEEIARRDREEEEKIAAYALEKERVLQARKEAQEAAFKYGFE